MYSLLVDREVRGQHLGDDVVVHVVPLVGGELGPAQQPGLEIDVAVAGMARRVVGLQDGSSWPWITPIELTSRRLARSSPSRSPTDSIRRRSTLSSRTGPDARAADGRLEKG